jgi:hypothetical protein
MVMLVLPTERNLFDLCAKIKASFGISFPMGPVHLLIFQFHVLYSQEFPHFNVNVHGMFEDNTQYYLYKFGNTHFKTFLQCRELCYDFDVYVWIADGTCLTDT